MAGWPCALVACSELQLVRLSRAGHALGGQGEGQGKASLRGNDPSGGRNEGEQPGVRWRGGTVLGCSTQQQGGRGCWDRMPGQAVGPRKLVRGLPRPGGTSGHWKFLNSPGSWRWGRHQLGIEGRIHYQSDMGAGLVYAGTTGSNAEAAGRARALSRRTPATLHGVPGAHPACATPSSSLGFSPQLATPGLGGGRAEADPLFPLETCLHPSPSFCSPFWATVPGGRPFFSWVPCLSLFWYCSIKAFQMCAAAEFGRSDSIDNKDTLFIRISTYFSNKMEARAKVIGEREKSSSDSGTPTHEVT